MLTFCVLTLSLSQRFREGSLATSVSPQLLGLQAAMMFREVSLCSGAFEVGALCWSQKLAEHLGASC